MSNKNEVSIIPLGGRGEIGNNMIIIENKDDMIILDTGILFPDEEHYGIDLIMPDISYLIKNKDKIRAIIFSHGHEDHIGAIPYILQKINPPLYGTDLTMKLIENKLQQFGLEQQVDINVIGSNDKYKPLKINSFEIEFCHVNHSIPASVAMGIKTPAGLIIYTGDYKFDQTPVNSPQTDYQKLSEWSRQGVLALLGDSTNAEREGHTLSELVVSKNIEDKFQLIEQRIIIATFSSNIGRIQQIIDAGYKADRKLAIAGASMLNYIETAAELDYINIPNNMLITLDQANKMDPDKVILLMTGSQGEYRAALTRIARGEYRDINVIPGDTVFISATPIPGNEKAVGETINMLYSQGASVVYDDMLDIHASGHACQEEIKMMINLTKPEYLIPVHGEFRHLFHHAQLAKQMGFPVENIFIQENGSKLKLSPEKAQTTDKINAGEAYIENNRINENGKIVLNDRSKLARNGYVNVIIPINNQGEFISDPSLLSRGFVHNITSKDLLQNAKNNVKQTIKKINKDEIKDWSLIKKNVTDSLNQFFYDRLDRSPLILTELIEINA